MSINELRSDSLSLRETSPSVDVFISLNESSSSNTENFGSDYEKWNNELMTINEIEDEEKRIDAQFELLDTIMYIITYLTESGIQALVQRCYPRSLYRCNLSGETPLHIVARSGKVDCIRAFLDRADPDYRNTTNKVNTMFVAYFMVSINLFILWYVVLFTKNIPWKSNSCFFF
eukprot:TRINITY_DN244868_c0_g1_i3.p1 TRINITY_DN244868_c0_g1~~TRINITY_DN244868_c0_g1_i3.p1  ORF type:complete len:194 (-),score=31.96 TRINITY_DN244868_c0_g1_i3:70-591(-)